MKKILALVSAVIMLAAVSTSCSKGCHCYLKADVTHSAPAFVDENMSKEECQAMEQQLNDEAGVDVYKCK